MLTESYPAIAIHSLVSHLAISALSQIQLNLLNHDFHHKHDIAYF